MYLRDGLAGDIMIGIDLRMPHIECTPASRQKIFDIGPFITLDEIVSRMKMDVGRAAHVALRAADALNAPDTAAVAAFREAFGVHPFPPDWPRGKWPAGKIVQQRFRGTLKLLESGALLYSCWGLPKRGGGPEAEPGYTIKTAPNKYWMAFGRKYWEEADDDKRTAMGLMAAMRVAYGEWVRKSPFSRNGNNVACYVKFAYRVFPAGLPFPITEGCSVHT
jgi:hypothetical protein